MPELRGYNKIKTINYIIRVQAIVTLVIAVLMWLIQNPVAGISAFAGGAVGFLTGLIYAKKMFAPQGSELKKVIRAHYSAEAYKLVFTILLFSFVFTQFKEVHALPLFATYIATLAVYWVALIFV